MSKLASHLAPALGGTALMMGAAYVGANATTPAGGLDPSAFPVSRIPVAEAPVAAASVPGAPTDAEAKAARLTGGVPGVVRVAAPGAPEAPEGGFGLGRPALEAEVAAWDIDIRPDGMGLPEGSGDVWTGEEIFVEKCAACHGDFGEAVGRWPQLAGGDGTLTSDDPVKTIGSYWPYLSTAWDYIYRAMPFGEAQSLEPDEVYAIVAYLMYLNNDVDDDFTLSRDNFLDVPLGNADGFFMDDRAETELPAFSGEPCMSDCTDGPVAVTMRSRVLDVTPDSGVVTEAVQASDGDNGITEDDASEETAALLVQDPEAVATAETGEAGEAIVEASQEGKAALDAIDPALVAEGEGVFRKCASCHQVGDGAVNRSGPVLNGIVGHPMGAVDGFRYSGALQEKAAAGEDWTDEALAAFLADPKGWLPGTKMSFRGLRDEAEIEAVIAYLATFER